MTSFLEPLMGMWPNSIGMVPGWPPTKIVQMVLIGWISRFSKCNFKKCSCLKLQGPELSNLIYSIIKKSSTNIWWTTLVVICKWLHLDPWPFTYSSGERPKALWALLFVNLLFLENLDKHFKQQNKPRNQPENRSTKTHDTADQSNSSKQTSKPTSQSNKSKKPNHPCNTCDDLYQEGKNLVCLIVDVSLACLLVINQVFNEDPLL